MNIQKLIEQLEDEVKLLRKDLKHIQHDVTARAIHTSIDNRLSKIDELKINYPHYIKE